MYINHWFAKASIYTQNRIKRALLYQLSYELTSAAINSKSIDCRILTCFAAGGFSLPEPRKTPPSTEATIQMNTKFQNVEFFVWLQAIEPEVISGPNRILP